MVLSLQSWAELEAIASSPRFDHFRSPPWFVTSLDVSQHTEVLPSAHVPWRFIRSTVGSTGKTVTFGPLPTAPDRCSASGLQ